MTAKLREELPPSSPPAKKDPTLLTWLGIMGALTVFAIAAGASIGLGIGAMPSKSCPADAKGPSAAGAATYGADMEIHELPPIITNLADPPGAWVRVQASIVFDRRALPKPASVAAEIGNDILGLMRTLSLTQLGGASGLQHLREDLNERATIRSGGVVRELLLQAVVFQ